MTRWNPFGRTGRRNNTEPLMARLPRWAVALIALVIAPASLSLPLTNGNFSAGLNSWNTIGPEPVTIVGGAARLATEAETGSDPFSAILVQGDDGFFNFSDPISLENSVAWLFFDIRQERLPDPRENGFSLGDDTLTVALYDALGSGSTDLFFVSGNDFSPTEEWQRVGLDVSSLAAASIALSFEVFDEADRFDTRFFLDNIVFAPRGGEVPISSTILLLTAGLMALRQCRRRLLKT